MQECVAHFIGDKVMGYYSLDEDTFDAIKLHIEQLNTDEAMEQMTDDEERFVRQMAGRLEQYDRNIICSPKQQKWLGDLFKKYGKDGYRRSEDDEDGIEATDTRFKRWSGK
jgi:hypothetical protein